MNSCSNVDDDLTDTSQTSNLQSTDYQNFMFRIDSLNAVYQASVLNDPTRGLVQYIANSKIESLADNAGRVVGGYLGRGLGSFVGGIFGSPIGAIGGYLVGRTVGSCAGSILASYGALYLLTRSYTYVRTDSIKFDCYIPENSPYGSDSLGYYHNLVMVELSKNHVKYIGVGGSLNYELIYDDCVKILRENGFVDEGVFDDETLRKDIIAYAEETVALSNDCKNNIISENEYQLKLKDGMRDRNVPEEDVKIFTDFALKIVDTTALLPTDGKKDYADEVNNIIYDSALDPYVKLELSSTTNMLVNSSICSESIK